LKRTSSIRLVPVHCHGVADNKTLRADLHHLPGTFSPGAENQG
jgi:hypothetical protein